LKILLATNNQKKFKEATQMLIPLGIEVSSPAILGIPFEVDETGTTFEENAALKSEALFVLTGLPCLADDSGICVSHLNGAPGVYSARYGEPHLDDRGRAEFLLENLHGIEDRKATYVCCLAFTNEKRTYLIREECHGLITTEYDSEGIYGFGYDPIFFFPPFQNVFSRVVPEQKNEVSHRGKALKIFYDHLKNGNYQ
jgi:XTP/dITP diphosphohydrolase